MGNDINALFLKNSKNEKSYNINKNSAMKSNGSYNSSNNNAESNKRKNSSKNSDINNYDLSSNENGNLDNNNSSNNGNSNGNSNGNDNGNGNGNSNSNGNLKSSSSIYRISSGGNNINNLKRVTSTNHHYNHNLEEDEIDSSMAFAPTRNGYLSQSAYDFVSKELEEEMYPQKMFLTRAEYEENDLDVWNDSFSEDDEYSGQIIDYSDDDYINIYSQPNYNEINDIYKNSIQNIFEKEFELSSLIDNENDEPFQYRYMVDDILEEANYDYPEMGMASNSSGNNYASYDTTPTYNKRRSSQGLTVDTTRKSRSHSRSYASANPLNSGNGDHRSRSRSHSRSRTRSKSMNTPSSQRRLSIGLGFSFSDNNTHDNGDHDHDHDHHYHEYYYQRKKILVLWKVYVDLMEYS